MKGFEIGPLPRDSQEVRMKCRQPAGVGGFTAEAGSDRISDQDWQIMIQAALALKSRKDSEGTSD